MAKEYELSQLGSLGLQTALLVRIASVSLQRTPRNQAGVVYLVGEQRSYGPPIASVCCPFCRTFMFAELLPIYWTGSGVD